MESAKQCNAGSDVVLLLVGGREGGRREGGRRREGVSEMGVEAVPAGK